MSAVTFKPLGTYPEKQTRDRRNSAFKPGYNATLRSLSAELFSLTARDVVLQIVADPATLRDDGFPLADTRTRSPAVVLSFTVGSGIRLQFPCDQFTDWKDNLRAIAVTLQALRKMGEHGLGLGSKQYRGWMVDQKQQAPPEEKPKPKEPEPDPWAKSPPPFNAGDPFSGVDWSNVFQFGGMGGAYSAYRGRTGPRQQPGPQSAPQPQRKNWNREHETAAREIAAMCHRAGELVTAEKILTDPAEFKRAAKIAKRRTHPDAQTGTADSFKEIMKACDKLDALHGI